MSTGDPWGQIDDSAERDQKNREIAGRNKRFTVVLMFVSFAIGVVGILGGLFTVILGLAQIGLAGLAFGVIGIGNGFWCLMDLFRDPEAERLSRRERYDDRPRRSTKMAEKRDDDLLDIQ